MREWISILFVLFMLERKAQGLDSLKKMMVDRSMGALGVKGSINDFSKAVNSSEKEALKSINSAAKTVTSTFNAVFDLVDDHALEAIFAQCILPELVKDFGKYTCLEGITITSVGKGTLQLHHGKLLHFNSMKLLPKITQQLRESILVELPFIFSDFILDYSWEFKKGAVFGLDRSGTMQIVQTGPNTVTVTGSIPKSRHVIEALKLKKRCFLTVKNVQLLLAPMLTVEEVFYDSFLKDVVGKGITELYIKDMIGDVQDELQDRVKKALKVIFAPVTDWTFVFCESGLIRPETVICDNISNTEQ